MTHPVFWKSQFVYAIEKEREKIKENEMQENVAIVSSGPSANLSMSIFVQSLNERLVIR